MEIINTLNHSDFIDKVNDLGINVYSNNSLKKEKVYSVPYGLYGAKVKVSGTEVEYIDKIDNDAFENLVKKCIDLDHWKYSRHISLVSENYKWFREIIQDKILERAEEIEMLLTTYFLLHKRITDIQENQ